MFNIDVWRPRDTCIGHHDHYLVNPAFNMYMNISVTDEGKLMFDTYLHQERPNDKRWEYLGEYGEFPPELYED